MKRVALLLCLTACSLWAPRVEVQPVFESAVRSYRGVRSRRVPAHSSALSVVVAEGERPLNDSSLGVLQQPGIDLTLAAVQDFTLLAPLAASAPCRRRRTRAIEASRPCRRRW